jgi:hypothetical protein
VDIIECEGYKNLVAAIELDEKRQSGAHDLRGKLAWVIARAEHYGEKTGLNPGDILNAWERHRTYWYMNYYQDANQPEIKDGNVKVFESIADAKASIGQPQYRCPSCNGVSSDPYNCNATSECNWASYGLLGTMGKGAYIFIKSEFRVQELFMPLTWENQKSTVENL